MKPSSLLSGLAATSLVHPVGGQSVSGTDYGTIGTGSRLNTTNNSPLDAWGISGNITLLGTICTSYPATSCSFAGTDDTYASADKDQSLPGADDQIDSIDQAYGSNPPLSTEQNPSESQESPRGEGWWSTIKSSACNLGSTAIGALGYTLANQDYSALSEQVTRPYKTIQERLRSFRTLQTSLKLASIGLGVVATTSGVLLAKEVYNTVDGVASAVTGRSLDSQRDDTGSVGLEEIYSIADTVSNLVRGSRG